MNSNPEISIVVPVFNEEPVIEEFFSRVTKTLKEFSYELIFVDDGSRDRSYELLKKCKEQAPQQVKVLKLARNFGHQLALTAGMKIAQGQAVIVMDGDLQDPPEVLERFLRKWREGYQVVYGVRTERQGEGLFKKATASLFYKLMRRFTQIDIPENVGDFYLLDRKVVDILNAMEERHRFLRGLIVWVGLKRVGIPYTRQARFAGTTKFGLWRMVKFSLDAMTSLSFSPLRFIVILGAAISALSFLGILVTIYMKLFTSYTIIGWASLMVAILFIGGVQLLALGLIGEYIARIGDDVKHRPLYTVEEIL